MIKNYIKTAFRHIRRDLLFSGINILGLAIGMSCSILIMLWVYDEISFDRFHENYESLYRTVAVLPASSVPVGPIPLGERLVNEFPEIINSCNFEISGEGVLKYEEIVIEDIAPVGVEPSVFEMFSFEIISKQKDELLTDFNEVILTETTARKLFGDEDPLGKMISFNIESHLMVTAIIKDVPDNSHLKFDMLYHFYHPEEMQELKDNWGTFGVFPYVQVVPGVKSDSLNAKLKNFFTEVLGENYNIGQLELQPLKEIHLYSSHYQELYAKIGDIKYVMIFTIVSILILVIACINFMNLSTAKALKRVKDIGVRKVSGAFRRQIIMQYLGESFIIAFIALLFALLLVDFLLPVFNSISQKNISMDVFSYKEIFWLILITVITGLFSGSYTAVYLSKINAIQILANSPLRGKGSKIFRQMLVVVQFSISIALIIFSFSVRKQMNYMHNKDLGYEIDNVFKFDLGGEFSEHYETIRAELLKYPEVENVTISSNLPINIVSGSYGVDWEGKEETGKMQLFNQLDCDAGFIDAMKIELLAGRDFYDNIIADSANLIINETAARLMGFDDPIGKSVEGRTVIGLIKDFHFRTMHTPIAPLLIFPSRYSDILQLRISDDKKIKSIISDLHQMYPDYNITFQSLRDVYSKLYYSETRTGKMFDYFSILAILLSCLGLFGLSAYTAEQRTKEIGIRKALGSSNSAIIRMLETEFIKWILISNIIAWPITYFFVKSWLESFTYRIDVSIAVFIISSIIAIGIALLTVLFHAYKSSVKNPVDCLRYE